MKREIYNYGILKYLEKLAKERFEGEINKFVKEIINELEVYKNFRNVNVHTEFRIWLDDTKKLKIKTNKKSYENP